MLLMTSFQLHTFRHDYYGGQWASFCLDGLEKLPITEEFNLKDDIQKADSQKHFYNLGNHCFKITNFSFKWNIPK